MAEPASGSTATCRAVRDAPCESRETVKAEERRGRRNSVVSLIVDEKQRVGCLKVIDQVSLFLRVGVF